MATFDCDRQQVYCPTRATLMNELTARKRVFRPNAYVRFGSKAEENGPSAPGPFSDLKLTQFGGKRTLGLERPFMGFPPCHAGVAGRFHIITSASWFAPGGGGTMTPCAGTSPLP